jgi:hypothetical protein
MANKGLDTTFVHFGIRKEDMNLIEALCTEHQLDFDWVKDDLLKEFHERKIPSLSLEFKTNNATAVRTSVTTDKT